MIRRFAVCVLVGAVGLGVAARPVAAAPERIVTGSHYRCMYHCDERAHLFEDTAPTQESRPRSLAQTATQPKSTFCRRTAPDPANPVTNLSALADRVLSWLYSAFCTSPTAQPAAAPLLQAGLPPAGLLPARPQPAQPLPAQPLPAPAPPLPPPTMGKPTGWWPFPSGWSSSSSGPTWWKHHDSWTDHDWWNPDGWWDHRNWWERNDGWDHHDWWQHDWWDRDDGWDRDDRGEQRKSRDHDDDDRWRRHEKRQHDDDDRWKRRKQRDRADWR